VGNNLKYTCKDYREEMILLGLQRQLKHSDLTPEEKAEIRRRIEELECRMEIN